VSKASLVVINWNGASFLDACLDSLLSEVGLEDKIIVVDNDSADHSVDLLRAYFPQIKLIRSGGNLGYAGGANVGIRAARGDIIVLLNPDIEVCSGWLVALKSVLAHERIGVAGCKLLYPGGRIIQHAGGIIRGYRAAPDHFGYGQVDDGRWDELRDVDYVTGAAFAFRRDLVQVVGLFDEGFYPAYSEEVDFCIRVRNAGYRVVYAPDATAIHYEYSTLGAGSASYYHLFHNNRLRLVLKHLAPMDFMERFIPEETEWLRTQACPSEQAVLSHVYLTTILSYPDLCADLGSSACHGGLPMQRQVLASLSQLYAQACAI